MAQLDDEVNPSVETLCDWHSCRRVSRVETNYVGTIGEHVNLLAAYNFALASRRKKLSLAACVWRIFSSAVWNRSRLAMANCEIMHVG